MGSTLIVIITTLVVAPPLIVIGVGLMMRFVK